MTRARWTLFWLVVIAGLVLIELAEVTRVFTLPLGLATLSPVNFLFPILLITVLALVGAVFVGFYLSSQVYAPRGFTPFEQEMLRMRQEVTEMREELRALSRRTEAGDPPAGAPPRPPGSPP